MFKSYRNVVAALATIALGASSLTAYEASRTYDFNKKQVIDGGVYYPVKDGKKGPYYVNEKAHDVKMDLGRKAKDCEIDAWNVDVMYYGEGLPEGKGSVEFGEEVYEEKCLQCHGDFGSGKGLYPHLTAGNAYEEHKTLKNQRLNPDDEGPHRTFGSYWPYASTAWWYIKTGMPHQAPMTLTDDEVYALVAYMLYINELRVDGEEVDEEFVLSKENFLKIEMPNVDGFVPDIRGKEGLERTRKFWNGGAEADLKNWGGVRIDDPKKRCMKDCFKGEPIVQRIHYELKEFNPPMGEGPKVEKKTESEEQKLYKAHCAVCHDVDTMGAPKIGDKATWDAVMKKGMDKVMANTINGINAMPPKGGTTLSDEKLKAIVEYMIEASK